MYINLYFSLHHANSMDMPQLFITDRSKAVVLLWFSFARFGIRVSVTFHLTWVHIIFSSVSVAEWPPFGK